MTLGERLGMARPTNLRSTIEAHRERLEDFGTVHAVREPFTTGNGTVKTTTAYYLNEEQALYICALSRTEAGHRRTSGCCIRRVQ